MLEDDPDASADSLALTAQFVSAYARRNSLSPADLTALIFSTHAALKGLTSVAVAEAKTKSEPAFSIKKSVTPEFIVCLECGREFKSIKRHLAASHKLTPDAYRAKWDLPDDYPITAPEYTARRSDLAKARGLGRKKKFVAPASEVPIPTSVAEAIMAPVAAPAPSSIVAPTPSPVAKPRKRNILGFKF